MIQLPNEVVNQVLEELWDDTGTLMSCIQTCSRLRSLTHRILYDEVTINLIRSDTANRTRLHRVAEVLPVALPHMRVLRIELGPMDLSTHILARLLFCWISEEGRVKELYLRGHLERLRVKLMLPLLMLPTIELLSLIECTNIPITIFQNRPGLRVLRLRYSSVWAPFDFSNFYSTEAVYGFPKHSTLDNNGIAFPDSLDLSLGVSENPEGDRILVQRCAPHLTTLTLCFRSIIPKNYESFACITCDCFPSLSSLCMIFEVVAELETPVDVIAFVHGRSRKPAIKELRLVFNFEASVFEHLVVEVPEIMTSPRPFEIAQVFDRKMLPFLETGCCILRLSAYDLTGLDAEQMSAFRNSSEEQFGAFFPRGPGFEWVNLAVELSEASEEDLETSS